MIFFTLLIWQIIFNEFSNIDQALHHWNNLHLFAVYTYIYIYIIYIKAESDTRIHLRWHHPCLLDTWNAVKKFNIYEWSATAYLYTCNDTATTYSHTCHCLYLLITFPVCVAIVFSHPGVLNPFVSSNNVHQNLLYVRII